jgi:GT2 family glycosyltransferase
LSRSPFSLHHHIASATNTKQLLMRFLFSWPQVLWQLLLLSATPPLASSGDVPTVYIVMTVKTSYSIVKECLDSLARHKPAKLILQQKIVLVDDGSPAQTIAFEKELCSQRKSAAEFHCLQTENGSQGYTFAINKGIKYSLSLCNPDIDAILLLNSDVVVTFGWLTKLYQSLYSNEKVMLVGPMSNAATFQSIPHTSTPGRGWSTNPLPYGLSIDYLAYLVSIATPSQQNQDWPPTISSEPVKLTIINGFCYLMKASVFSKVGYFDDVSFPGGYGEEVDYSLRVQSSGYLAHFLPSVYIYHRKTASFTTAARNQLKGQANKILRQMHGPELAQFGKTTEESRKQVSYLEEQIGNVYYIYQKRFTIPSKSSEKLRHRLTPQLTSTAALTSSTALLSNAIASPEGSDKPAYRALYIMGLSSTEYRSQLKWKSSLLRLLTSIKESGHEISILDRPLLFENITDPRGTSGQFSLNGIPQIHHTSIKSETLNSMFLSLHSDLFNLDRYSSSRGPDPALVSSIERFMSFDLITSDSCSAILFLNRFVSRIQQLPSFRGSKLPLLVLYGSFFLPPDQQSTSSTSTVQSPNLEKFKSSLMDRDRDLHLRQCHESLLSPLQKEEKGSRIPYIVTDSEWSATRMKKFFQERLPSQHHAALDSHLVTIPTPVDHLKYFWDQTQMYSRHGKVSPPISTFLSGGLVSVDEVESKRSRPYRALVNLHQAGSLNNIEFVVDLLLLLLEKSEQRLSLTVLGSQTLLTDAYEAILLDRTQSNPSYLPPKYFKIKRLESKYIDFVETNPRSQPRHTPISISSSSQSNSTPPAAPVGQEIFPGYPELLRRHDVFLDLSLSHSSSQDLLEMISTGCVPIIPLTSPSVCQPTGASSPICLQFDTSDAQQYSDGLLSLIGVNPPMKYSSGPTRSGGDSAISLRPSLLPEMVIQGHKHSIPLSIELSAATLSIELNKISRARK